MYVGITNLQRKKLSGYNRGFRILAAAACLLLVVGTWYLITSRASLETIILGPADTRMTYVLPDSSVVWLAAEVRFHIRTIF